MSTENIDNSVNIEDLDLDAFTAEFYGQNKAEDSVQEEEANPSNEETNHDEDENDALDADTSDEEDGSTQENDDNDDTSNEEDAVDGENEKDDEDGETDPEPPVSKRHKKQTFQERINEVIGEKHDLKRQLEAALAQIENLKQPHDDKTPSADSPKPQSAATNTGPAPNDLNEDGTEKYPLGEFDPAFIRDLTIHTLEQESKLRREQEAKEAEERKITAQKEQLQAEWQSKLGPAQERYPDFNEKGQNLVSTFESLDSSYGEYLAATIKSMEFGPDVLYYLANHLDIAEEIVSSGPTKATIALGRLESRFADADLEKRVAKPRVSKAPTPPPTNRGSAVAVPEIPVDTDNLDNFEALFYKKKGRSK